MLQLNHKKLEVWKSSVGLVTEVYLITKTFPKEEMFGLTNQLRRAAISVTSNIAEGSLEKAILNEKDFMKYRELRL